MVPERGSLARLTVEKFVNKWWLGGDISFICNAGCFFSTGTRSFDSFTWLNGIFLLLWHHHIVLMPGSEKNTAANVCIDGGTLKAGCHGDMMRSYDNSWERWRTDSLALTPQVNPPLGINLSHQLEWCTYALLPDVILSIHSSCEAAPDWFV